MALTGSLREVELADVFQLISMARKTGILTIASPQERARLYFQDGRPVHATCDAGTGEEAVYNLLARSEGDFSFEPTAVDCPVTIRADMQTLMLEGMRRVDHIQLLKGDLPAGDAVLRIAPEAPEAEPEGGEQAEIGEPERTLLALVDGRRSVAELVRASGLPEINAHEALHRLISQKRVVEWDPGTPEAARESALGSPQAVGIAGERSMPSAEDIERLIQRIASL
ncbi:MAG: DUF4388 domain-containing protein [Armatimonadota bacterium]|jgi:hypothetical protein